MSSSVSIISYTNGEKANLQELVAYTARVSNPDNQNNSETANKLLNYLMKNKHWSPFEMVNICLEIKTTRDIARQILRHRSFSFQEFSQRYAVAQDFTLREARMQDNKNRQNSIDNADMDLQKAWEHKQQGVIDEAKLVYQWALDKGIAKEQARAVLPEGNTMSTLYVNGTLRSWIHYIELRKDASTQKEHREVAEKCLEQIVRIVPLLQN
mgnify:FL=1|jgi:thymidylate synthase (FAD)|tara:strand:- start:184 stop:816 length:633 start_codon:yes stop_codon:yes gene_type:complete